MIDYKTLMPLLQAMNKGNSNIDTSQLEGMMSLFNGMNNASGGGNKENNQNNNLMNMLPILMQMMNKNNPPADNNTQNAPKEEEKRDPLEPIKNIGNDSINNMLYNLMNKK